MRTGPTLALLLLLGCSRYAPPAGGEGGDDSTVLDSGGTDTDIPDRTVIDPRLALDDVQHCADPAAEVSYTEVGAAWGLEDARTVDPDNETSGGALAVFDYDQDGDLDLIVGYKAQDVVVYQNQGDLTFTPITLTGIGCVGTGLNVADLDGDGWEDLLVGKPPTILRNDQGSFDTDSPVFPRWEGEDGAMELAPGDLDGDGLPELYALTNTSSEAGDEAREDVLFLNRGDLVFEEDPDGVPDVPEDGKGFDALWYDEDWDGDLDVYVSNDVGNIYGENVLWRNEGGVLVNANDACGCGVAMTGMGVDAGDFDRDGNLDLFLTHGAGETLLQRFDSGVYFDVSESLGVSTDEMGWGAIFLDRDNDGDQDVFIALGNITFQGELDGQPGDGLALLDQVDGQFVDVAPELGLDSTGDAQGSYRSTVAVDFNGDGLLDLVGGEVHRRPKVYLSDACTADNWLEVWAPVGTRVVLQAGADVWYDEVMYDSGRGSAGPAMVHFGLGDHATFNRLKLILPGGEEVLAEGTIEARRIVRYAP